MNGYGFKLIATVFAMCVVASAEQGENRPPMHGENRPPMHGGWKENGRPGHGMGGWRADGFRMFMEKLKKQDPETYEKLEKLRVTDRNAYFAELRKLLPSRPMVPNKVGQLDHKCQKLSQQYHEARTDGEKEAIRKELVQAVEEATDAMITDMKERLKMMSERLAELEKNRKAAIDSRVEMLLKEKPGKNGQPPMPPPPPGGTLVVPPQPQPEAAK